MLNYAKVMYELKRLSDELFIDTRDNLEYAYALWDRLCSDNVLQERVRRENTGFVVPSWDNSYPLNHVHRVEGKEFDYIVMGIDGSQIYPDKHQGTTCSLINIGIVELSYGKQAHVSLCSEPLVLPPTHDEIGPWSVDAVNNYRQALELSTGFERVTAGSATTSPILLFDGSLIFWHLSPDEKTGDRYFFDNYMQSLLLLYEQKIITAWYSSLTRSKELVALLKATENLVAVEHAGKDLSSVLDAHLVQFFLQEGERSSVFAHRGQIVEQYPDYAQPYFFYIHAGTEIGRVEIPAWIAHDDNLLESVARVIMDQLRKGNGYPVALAEAHEQAVVKGPDRDFFYQLIYKYSIEHRKKITISQKSMRKRKMGI